jgi:hypothetical protein
MKNNKASHLLFIILWFIEAAALILFGALQFLPQNTVAKNIFWILIAFSIVLSLAIKYLDKDRIIYSGEYLKSQNPMFFALYNLSFKVIPIFMIILGLFSIRISWQ